MVEKKFVVEELRYSYNGPFDIIQLYKLVEDWIESNGMHKEIKKKLEHTEKESKKLEWFIEIWKNPADYAKQVVRLRILGNNIKEFEKNKKTYQKGEILVVIDGILETDVEARWQQKPTFFFLRSVIDKYIWKIYTNRFEGDITADVYSLHKHMKEFFDEYKVLG